MSITPQSSAGISTSNSNYQLATVAAGCFWGVEHLYRHKYEPQDAIISQETKVGYIGGNTDSPSYRAVCSGRTGHAEALQIQFDPSKTSYKNILEFFYKMHDPTTANRQGPDVGTQYRSGIFYHNPEQQKVAQEVTKLVQEQWYKDGKVSTEILPAGQWWNAEDYHQKYLDVNPGGYECPSHFLRKFPDLVGGPDSTSNDTEPKL